MGVVVDGPSRDPDRKLEVLSCNGGGSTGRGVPGTLNPRTRPAFTGLMGCGIGVPPRGTHRNIHGFPEGPMG